ncbi:MAG: hypothetical protein HXX17_10765 [Geobacteraceae bacterium]|nr:hypothetical protein [Geobacteraceae bacterium]
MIKNPVIIVVMLLLSACVTTEQSQQKQQESGFKIVDAGKNQSGDPRDCKEMVTIFVGAHDSVMSELGGIKSANKQVVTDLTEIKNELGSVKATGAKALETAQKSLQIIEEMSKVQGTGEITTFFSTNSATIEKNSLEFQRLVHFADFLSRESRGRKIIFLSIGSASAKGKGKTNLRLAKKRSETPLDILDKYLVNIPHEFYKVYGTGDLYSPKGVKMKEHERYQHTRIIALFDTAQAPKVNEEANAASNR